MHATPQAPHPETVSPNAAWFDRLCVLAFVVSIGFVPIMTMFQPGGEGVIAEQRRPAPFPARPRDHEEFLVWPRKFERAWDDAWAIRGPLLQMRQRLLVLTLGVSPTSKLVLGRDGWLYPGFGDAVEQHRGMVPFTQADLEKWQHALEARSRICAELGVPYVYVLVPNKLTVYPDHLPSSLVPIGPTRTEQVVEWLRRHSDVRVLDLRETMRREREHDEGEDFAYFPLGTHWTDRGAFAGYTKLLDELHALIPSLRPAAREQFLWEDSPAEPGDTWAGRLYLRGRLVQQVRTASRIDPPPMRQVPFGTLQDRAYETDQPDAPSLLMFHDSNGAWIRPFLAPHFARSFFQWTDDFDAQLVRQWKPDVVVQLSTEDRAMAIGVLPQDP